MNKVFRRTLAFVMTMFMLLSLLPLNVFAVDSPVVKNESVAEIKQTNSLSKMLAENLDESESPYNSPYYISDITYKDYIITVNFYNEAACKLVVSIYDENTEQLLESYFGYVTEEAMTYDCYPSSKAPDHFIVKAFLLDDNNAGLCKAYTCYNYTTEYESLNQKTINDFDEEYVINFDSEKDNNFAVLSDDIKIIKSSSNVNTLYSMDIDKNEYVITNIDSSIENLKDGDMFYLDNGNLEDIVAIKIKSISISGTTATVIAEDTELEEIYEFIKIDTTLSIGEAIYNGESADEAVEYLGDVDYDSEEPVFTQDASDFSNYELSKSFNIKKKESKNKSGKITGTYSGKATLKAKVGFSATVSKDYKEVSFKVEPSFKIEAKAEGSVSLEIKLGELSYRPVVGVYLGFEPTFTVKTSGSIDVTCQLQFTVGMGYISKSGFVNKCKKPSFTPSIDVEGTLFIGIDLKPHVSVISEHVVDLEVSGLIGVEVKAANGKKLNTKEHSCKKCIEGEVYGTLQSEVKLVFGEDTSVEKEYKATIINSKVKIGHFYYSITNKKYGFGFCPYYHEIISFGSYPQTHITDSNTISNLNNQSKTWKSYKYYSGSGSDSDGKMAAGDYMEYADISYNNQKYRAVRFSSYRPSYTGYKLNGTEKHIQQNNGYVEGKIHYFKFEPLKWRVLDPSSGLVMCEKAIDSQAFNNYIEKAVTAYYGNKDRTYLASDWKNSSLKKWLNNNFYNDAFSNSDKAKINENYKVFLLSKGDAVNSKYGFNSNIAAHDAARQMKSTDYAKCQGCWKSSASGFEGNSQWWLLTSNDSKTAFFTQDTGFSTNAYGVGDTSKGIVPALRLYSNCGLIANSATDSEIQLDDSSKTININDSDDYVNLAYSFCIAGNDYILLSVADYTEDFNLLDENLLYIDQLTADENGKVSKNFIPRYNDYSAVNLLIGDFGKGTEARIIKAKSKVDSMSVTLNDTEVKYKTKDAKLNPVINIDDGVGYTVKYESSNPKVATVDKNGNITTTGKGETTITCTVTDDYDNVAKATCKLTVKFSFGQWLIWILLFGFLWY
ncbi:MAG: Ig-like domain-containing protein [Clostridia bacterium]|nr:Ig-like domain-containing protein [Clostridia bacterium]